VTCCRTHAGADSNNAPRSGSFVSKQRAAPRLHRVPGKPADLGQLEAAVGFDLLDHRPQGVDVGGQGARRIPGCAVPGCHQGAFARAGDLQLWVFAQQLLQPVNGLFCEAGRAGDLEQFGEVLDQAIGVQGWQGHGSTFQGEKIGEK
jgi:hypothetical protein